MTRSATAWTASVSGYYEGYGRAGQVRRVHLVPPDGTFPRRRSPAAACGQPWWDVQDAPRVAVTLGEPLPEGLSWCPKCLGVAVDVLGLSEAVGRLVAAKLGLLADAEPVQHLNRPDVQLRQRVRRLP